MFGSMAEFNVIFIIILVISGLMFIGVLAVIISPKLRGKLMGNQVKATKYMLDENKDTLTSMASNIGDILASSASNTISNNKDKFTNMASDMGDIVTSSLNNIVNNNEDKLRNVSNKTADISKDAIKEVAKSVKEGLRDSIYCKHCGNPIDTDSTFCKYCGKEQ